MRPNTDLSFFQIFMPHVTTASLWKEGSVRIGTAPKLRANGVGDSKDIVYESVWTIFCHVEGAGATRIATLIEPPRPDASYDQPDYAA